MHLRLFYTDPAFIGAFSILGMTHCGIEAFHRALITIGGFSFETTTITLTAAVATEIAKLKVKTQAELIEATKGKPLIEEVEKHAI